MGKIAFLFPGQGSQYPGMGKTIYENFPVAKDFFDKACEALDFDLKKMCFEGDAKELARTEYTQACLVAIEVMILKVIQELGIKPDIVAGLSLGEYTALVAAGAIDAIDAIKLVRTRGILMANALPAATTAMSAVLGLDSEILATACREGSNFGIVEIANYNCPNQVVIGGELKAVEEASKIALQLGARKIIPLNVSGAFHTSLLADAGTRLKAELQKIEIRDLGIPVIFNLTANYQDRPIIDLLEKQISSAVKFEESIKMMLKDGVTDFIEIGPGSVLSGFVKKTEKKAEVSNIEDLGGVERLVAKYGGIKDGK